MITRQLVWMRNRLATPYMAWRLGREPQSNLTRIGSKYGGWIIPEGVLNEDSICYCAGVGEDISFDLGLIERFGCHVWGIDPTPRAAAYVAKTAAGEARYHFVPEGLWLDDSVQRFYAPRNAEHVSHSIVNLQKTADFFEARCRRLSHLMAANGHKRIDLLKLDIEGAEYAVLQTLLEDNIQPTIVAVEFDQPTPLEKIKHASEEMLHAGYGLAAIELWNYTFVARNQSKVS